MKKIFSKYLTEISNKEANEYFKEYQILYEKNWILFDDTKNILDKLKNKYELVIITNGDNTQQRSKIIKTGIEKYFSDIIISSEVGYSKPDKQIFEIACNKLNVNPKECIMIGDNYRLDIQGAINVGIRGIWINKKGEKIDYKFQVVCLTELLQILN